MSESGREHFQIHIEPGTLIGSDLTKAAEEMRRALLKKSTLNGSSHTYSNTTPLPVLKSNGWDRPVTPLHFLAIIGGCAAAGFAIGIGAAAFLANHWGKKAMEALGL